MEQVIQIPGTDGRLSQSSVRRKLFSLGVVEALVHTFSPAWQWILQVRPSAGRIPRGSRLHCTPENRAAFAATLPSALRNSVRIGVRSLDEPDLRCLDHECDWRSCRNERRRPVVGDPSDRRERGAQMRSVRHC